MRDDSNLPLLSLSAPQEGKNASPAASVVELAACKTLASKRDMPL